MTGTSAELEHRDFIQDYLDYVGRTESPIAFHRWSAIGGLGAWLGKSVWFEHGGFKIYPNMYVQLFGAAGTRKSSAIKRFVSIMRSAGYRNFTAEKTSKEKFIEWMAGKGALDGDAELWGTVGSDDSSTDALIAADEFNDFFGANILDFLGFLGVMWDYEGDYEFSTRSGGSHIISNPCVSILSGNTPTMLAATIPPEAIGQGFFSRTLIIHGQETGIKIAFPPKPSEEETAKIVSALDRVKLTVQGAMEMSPEALALAEKIYTGWKKIADPRFDGYGNRRFTQLLKLCVIHAAAECSQVILPRHVVRSNTVLHRAELDMSKALGEFGQSKNAQVITKVLKIIERATKPISAAELWGQVHKDLDSFHKLSDILMGLSTAGKIQVVGQGILLNRKVDQLGSDEGAGSGSGSAGTVRFVDWEYLTPQEKVVMDTVE